MWLANSITGSLQKQIARHRFRVRKIQSQSAGVVDFSSNDYLSLRNHPQIINALAEGSQRYGFGSGGSAALSGYTVAHADLEKRAADFLQRPKALLFNSGYHANLAVMQLLAQYCQHFFSDKLCHASILQGIQSSHVPNHRFAHQKLAHLQTLLKKFPGSGALVTESIFSMEGDITPLADIITLSQQNSLALVIDDAHGIGVLGKQGRGIIEHSQQANENVHYLISPLGKACAGMGALVSGESDFIEALIQFSKPYLYSTALPPAIAYAQRFAFDIIERERWRRQQLHEHIDFFNRKASERIADFSATPSAIKIIPMANNQQAIHCHEILLKAGFHVGCIRYPTVANNAPRLRVSLQTASTSHQIEALLTRIAQYV